MFADDILHIENPKDPTKKTTRAISEFGKIAGYNLKICCISVYQRWTIKKEKLRKKSHFQSHKKEYLEVNLPKGGKRPVLWKL